MAAAAETTKYWGLFVVSTLIMIAMLVWVNEWTITPVNFLADSSKELPSRVRSSINPQF